MTALLETRGLAKRYPGVTALKGVDLSAEAGEVHALVGANGAGKSTLLNILCGVQRPSSGEILLDGSPTSFASPADALALGIATVHQEFSLVPQLSVARNVFLGREPAGRFGLVDRDRLLADTAALLARFDLALDPSAEVSRLSVAEQQLVEIARALSFDARVLILDEPTAVLSLAEQANLFGIVRRLRARGILVIFVSHHLREVLAIADRVTVLRDGERIATRPVGETGLDDLVTMITGEPHGDLHGGQRPAGAVGRCPAGGGKSFRIRYATDRGESRLSLASGEVVGLAGLVGAGRTTFARALAGLGEPTARAELAFDGRPVPNRTPREAIAGGVIYVTEDRKRDGLFAGLDIVANATAAVLGRHAWGPIRRSRRERRAAAEILTRLRLVAASLDSPIVDLSGGNQQKVLIARALLTRPRLILCDEPTRGVDVGAKEEIHRLLRELAAGGTAVLVVSSEVDELAAVCDRVVVMRDRRLVADLLAADAGETAILRIASGETGNREPAHER